jgi:hypothetical protein
VEQARKLPWDDSILDQSADVPAASQVRKKSDTEKILRLALAPKGSQTELPAAAAPKRDMGAAIGLVQRAAEVLSSSEDRIRKLEEHMRELLDRTSEKLDAAEKRIREAEARAQAAEARAQEADECLARLHDVIVQQFSARVKLPPRRRETVQAQTA